MASFSGRQIRVEHRRWLDYEIRNPLVFSALTFLVLMIVTSPGTRTRTLAALAGTFSDGELLLFSGLLLFGTTALALFTKPDSTSQPDAAVRFENIVSSCTVCAVISFILHFVVKLIVQPQSKLPVPDPTHTLGLTLREFVALLTIAWACLSITLANYWILSIRLEQLRIASETHRKAAHYRD